MGVTVSFQCDGCFRIDGGIPVESEFRSLTGRSHGFGAHSVPSVDTLAPTDWVAFDPYTGRCYCPSCWREIVKDPESDLLHAESPEPAR